MSGTVGARAGGDGTGTGTGAGTEAGVEARTGRTRTGPPRRSARALSPVVGKALEAALVVLFVGLLTTVLFGNVVPAYRTAAGQELAERTLAGAADRIEASVPAAAHDAAVRRRVELPGTIAGAAYRLRVDGRRLVLDHPHRGIGASTRLAIPDRVGAVRGSWESGGEPTVAVRSTDAGLVVVLRS